MPTSTSLTRTPDVHSVLHRISRNQLGTVTVEYTIVLCLVGVATSLALIGLGALLLQLYVYQEALALVPVP